MSALTDWLDAHRSEPWPWWSDAAAPAKELYEAYVAYMDANYPENRVMSVNDWSPALIDAGFRRERIAGGYVYSGLRVESRAERARGEAVGKVVRARLDREKAEHDARYHPEGYGNYPDRVETIDQGLGPQPRQVRGWARANCDHDMPREVKDRIAAEAAADEAAIAVAMIPFEPYLSWRPGDIGPQRAAQLAAWERRRAAGDQSVEAEIAEAEVIRRALAGLRSKDSDQSATSEW
jgi:hypothetical protein